MRRRPERAGFRVRTIPQGCPFMITGVTLRDAPANWLGPDEEKRWLAHEGTLVLLKRERIFLEWIESVVGVWAWLMG